MISRTKIIHITSKIGKNSTGLGALTLDLTQSQLALGLNAEIWCPGNKIDLRWASESSGIRPEKIRVFPEARIGLPGFSFRMERDAAFVDGPKKAIVHQHGVWSGVSRVTNILRRVHNSFTVIGVQGSLSHWALGKSQWKKRIALALYERHNLHSASCLHAVGENEISDYRDFGLSNPIAMIPNGVSSDWLNSDGDGGAFRTRFGIQPDKRVLLFLSRVTPKKGLLMLLEVMDKIRKQMQDWQLVIAGADEFGHQAELESLIVEKGLTELVIFVGPLFNKEKRDAYAAADCFILPSYSEGAPLVILEALASGVPVVTTKASPWQELETYRCGWWTGVSDVALAEALKEAVSCSRLDLEQMGRRGKELVCAKYTWEKSARMTKKLYEWLLGRADKPEFMIID
ncbi:MAG TPA: glycosyltransferase [Bacteroidota bacterium]|jgi:glycosyltransferase involved in cell wall biosynthesis